MVTAVLAITMVPLGLAALAMGLSGGGIVGLGLGVLMLAMFAFVISLSRRGYARSVRFFSDEGLERNDGRRVTWAEVDRVVYRIRTIAGEKKLWRIEIRFRDGDSAWLLPLRIANAREVSEYVGRLPCAQTEEPA